MTAFSNSFEHRRATASAACAALFCAALLAAPTTRPDEPPSDSVGVIEGEAISVSGPMTVESAHGQIRTVLRSGSDVRVNSGSARIDLVEGGQISICGPAHLSMLKSGGSLTIALDTGTIHVHVEHAPTVTVYTPQIQLQSVPVGDGPQDVLVGFDAPGAMCIRANRGAVRAEQQLTGQRVLIPQGGNVLLVNGELDGLQTGAGHCVCDLQAAKPSPTPQPEIGQVATTEEAPKKPADSNSNTPPAAVDAAPAKEEPIYQVFMPPLIYDANTKVQPQIDPKMIVLVRRARVRPTLIFQGRVEGELVTAATPAPAPLPPPAAAASTVKSAVPVNTSMYDRVRNFVRKLWPSGS